MDGTCRLFHQEGHGAFRDAADDAGITQTQIDRPVTCWFWDFDNDGWLDVFVNDYDCSLAETIADYMGLKLEHLSHSQLFRNLEGTGFRDIGEDVGLVHPISARCSRTPVADGTG